ncbi:MAG: hypothetical protein HeimC3_52990 [Candidatus Heimdallarchaeota archaeon LC_3]|nr:MAG: hypothetical protein HeimC3_52990 [Candidatus Heimdallarchaeota archaeon LC_3]
MLLLYRFLGTLSLPDRSNNLVKRSLFLGIIAQFAFMISSTFYVLFVLDIVNYELLGTLLAVQFLVQAILDYPTGVLADWIGQRWVMVFAYFSYSISFYLLSIATTFEALVIVYAISAIGSSQESGTWGAWFDNNYKVSTEGKDDERKIYRLMQSRMEMLIQISASFVFIIGGFLATYFGRPIIFQYQALAILIFALLVVFLVTDYPEIEREPRSLRNYFRLMGKGLYFVLFTKYLLLFVIGMMITTSIWVIWSQMILFPMYFRYSGTDFGANLFRVLAWVIMIIITFFAGKWSMNISIKKYPGLKFIHQLMFFGGFAIIIFFYPLNHTRIEYFAIFLVLFLFTITDVIYIITSLLEQSLFIDVIPDANRNSIYSLLPTLILLFNAPVVLISGTVINIIGIPATLLLLVIIGTIGVFFQYLAIQLLPQKKKKSIEVYTN